ncbi:Arylsulfatase [Rosistilla ulvae]|uniref:Arylsulfatase n=1 Tax=Rosistilla ulvae TaxID=1930277 RepID=A0A517M878_9BACT|nr:arylsulfatase [Rosistilla ulvae]QDS91091.1 Arylsulfatase [Rosistilla ulvae]
MSKHLIVLFSFSLFTLPSSLAFAADARPNIVVIYADDLGYGDVSCYGATAVATPHIDRIAAEGIRFTDGHAPAATCTPSRYAMLTGQYAWRLKGTGIARGDAPAIIKPGRVTLSSMLQDSGYKTGVVGKWHLGLGPDEGADWNGKIAPGPLEIGFDYCFLIPATGDRVPCVYVENHRVVDLDPNDPIRVSFKKKVGDEPTGAENPELLKIHPSHGHDRTIVNGISRIGYMSGGQRARWVDEDMADRITSKAVAYIEENKADPFFLFFSLHDIHVPRVPHPRFVGTTAMGPRGDAIAQTDWCTGEILAALDRLKLADNTIVLFTSDNGPVVDDGYQDEAAEKLGDHRPAGTLRGGKYSSFEGGTRVPFVLRWPAKVKANQSSDALVCQIDLLHSFAALTGQTLAADAGPDSHNILGALLGEDPKGREHLVEHARTLALRQGVWKYIEPGKGPAVNKNTNTEVGVAPQSQLYNLRADLREQKNLADQHPQRVVKMKAMLDEIRSDGASR